MIETENKHGSYNDLARVGEQESEMSVKRNYTDKGQERVQWDRGFPIH